MERDLSARYLSTLLFNNSNIDKLPVLYRNVLACLAPVFDIVQPHEFMSYVNNNIISKNHDRRKVAIRLRSMLMGIHPTNFERVFCTYTEDVDKHVSPSYAVRSGYLCMPECTSLEKLRAFMKTRYPSMEVQESITKHPEAFRGCDVCERFIDEGYNIAGASREEMIIIQCLQRYKIERVAELTIAAMLHNYFELPAEPTLGAAYYRTGQDTVYVTDCISNSFAIQLFWDGLSKQPIEDYTLDDILSRVSRFRNSPNWWLWECIPEEQKQDILNNHH